jgi:hypothetical protein
MWVLALCLVAVAAYVGLTLRAAELRLERVRDGADRPPR